MKKIVALMISLMMVISLCGIAFAADGDLTVDPKISISGFQDGDSVTAYQFITWDEANNEWKVADGVGLTLDEITNGLTKDELATLASHTDKMTQVSGTLSGNTWEKTCGTVATAGSYLILITSNNQQYVYNPAVVSADFSDKNTASVDVSSSEAAALIKKQEITLDKKIDNDPDDYDVQAGDIVNFTIEVTVPQYNTNWTEPEFIVTDQLSTGLTLNSIPEIAGLTVDTDYKVTAATGGNTFKIEFTENYLKDNASALLKITYTALVGDEVKDTAQVHEETNTVTVQFSNDPTNKDSHKELTDETHHYTFAIDATRFGPGSDKTTELIKVGVDENGNPITAYKTTGTVLTGASPLQGAEFTLTGVGPNDTANGYTMTATSDADGRIFFNNLEVGTYKLQETKAPAGYMKDTTEHTVVISAEYNGDGTLKNYTIEIDGSATSTYTVTTDPDTKDIASVTPDEDNNMTFPINNTRGSQLPETGGIGTTIFYVSGLVMVLGAAAILVARRKAESEA